MDPDSFVLDGENQYMTVRASPGDGPHTPARGGKLIITDSRTLFLTKTKLEAIPHTSLTGISLEETPESNIPELLAAGFGTVGLGAIGYWGAMLSFDISTWFSLAMPMVGLVAVLIAGFAYRGRHSAAYETPTLHTPDSDYSFSASEEASFETASKIIAKNWKRRAPRF